MNVNESVYKCSKCNAIIEEEDISINNGHPEVNQCDSCGANNIEAWRFLYLVE